jgi:hypothetical protein
MSQTLAHAVDANKILLHDLYFVKKRAPIQSTVTEAVCTICDKGLGEEVSVTAKKIGQKIRFFCHYHLPTDI